MTAVKANTVAAVVLVSHLPTHRRTCVDALNAVVGTGCPVFYAGNAFLFPGARNGVPGAYLGENMAAAAALLRNSRPG